jgi:hypothetical protein
VARICQGTDAVSGFVDSSRITWLTSMQKGCQDTKSTPKLVRGSSISCRWTDYAHANTRPRTNFRSSLSLSGVYDCNICSKVCRWISNDSTSLIIYCESSGPKFLSLETIKGTTYIQGEKSGHSHQDKV